MSELLPREAFTTYVLMDGRNFFEYLNVFDLVYRGYYEQMTTTSRGTSTTTLRVILFAVALTLILAIF